MEPPMDTQQSDTWHTAEDAQERAWLDAWTRGQIHPTTLQPLEDTTISTGLPVLAGRH
jgi:hypothetical protein